MNSFKVGDKVRWTGEVNNSWYCIHFLKSNRVFQVSAVHDHVPIYGGEQYNTVTLKGCEFIVPVFLLKHEKRIPMQRRTINAKLP